MTNNTFTRTRLADTLTLKAAGLLPHTPSPDKKHHCRRLITKPVAQRAGLRQPAYKVEPRECWANPTPKGGVSPPGVFSVPPAKPPDNRGSHMPDVSTVTPSMLCRYPVRPLLTLKLTRGYTPPTATHSRSFHSTTNQAQGCSTHRQANPTHLTPLNHDYPEPQDPRASLYNKRCTTATLVETQR